MAWIPTLYMSEGLPYVLVNTVAGIMFFKLGMDLPAIGLWTSLLGYAWTVKPLWGPLVERYGEKRRWASIMQILMGISLGLMAFVLQGNFWWSIGLLVLGAVSLFSATHDIAADGYYMDALNEKQQSFYVGIRSTFFRISMILGQGILLMVAGVIEQRTGPDPAEFIVHAAPSAMTLKVEPPKTDGFLKIDPPLATLKSGEFTTVTIALAQKPEEAAQTVSLSRVNTSLLASFFPVGNETNVSLEDASKKKYDVLRFNQDNWNVPQEVVVKADRNLNREVAVHFTGSSGNLHLTWGICFGLVGAILLLFGLYHTFILPHAEAMVQAPKRVPFVYAAGIMAIVVAAPIVWYLALYYSLDYIFTHLNWVIISPETTKFVKVGLVVGITWLLFLSAEVRSLFKQVFSAAAKASDIPFDHVFASFFSRPGIGKMIAFLLIYRFGEALLLKMSGLFLQTPVAEGGLGLRTDQYGLAYGTLGVFGLLLGGMLGAYLASRDGLKRWILPMCLAINLPHLLYVYLAYFQPTDFWKIILCVSGETFGYGFGFTAYMIYMLYIAGTGEHKTSHFALCTGFMALSMLLPGMISGDIAKGLINHFSDAPHLGWTWFFIIVCLAIVPGLLMLKLVPLDENFGRRTAGEESKGRPGGH